MGAIKFTSLLVKLEDPAVGPVMRLLNNVPGVIDIKWDMRDGPKKPDDPRTGKPQPPRAGKSAKSRDLLKALLYERGHLSRMEINNALSGSGYAATSLDGALKRMREDGLVKGNGAEGYELTAKGKKE